MAAFLHQNRLDVALRHRGHWLQRRGLDMKPSSGQFCSAIGGLGKEDGRTSSGIPALLSECETVWAEMSRETQRRVGMGCAESR